MFSLPTVFEGSETKSLEDSMVAKAPAAVSIAPAWLSGLKDISDIETAKKSCVSQAVSMEVDDLFEPPPSPFSLGT